MDFNETTEHNLLRESVAKIASSFGHPWYAERARAGAKVDELWVELGRNGFLGVAIPEGYGGGGKGIVEVTMICEELAAAGCPLLMFIVSPVMCASVITKFGTDNQKANWLPKLACVEDPDWKMSFAFTEPDAGGNVHRLRTSATRHGDGYLLRGTKHYISGVDESKAIMVIARTGTDETLGRARLSIFVVDTDSPGLEKQPLPVELVAPERQFTLFFDDVFVPADGLIGTEGQGLRHVFSALNPERILGAAQATGIGRFALDKASAYARERQVWDVPIGAHQGIAHPLAIAKIELELARLMTLKAAWQHDTGADATEAANLAKYSAAEASLHALDQAIQVHGGNGLSSEYGLADLWFIARMMRTGPISREMILNFVAEASLGLPKSY
jgi:alkylation response protein AidB-like acyl-CoA dehydrogenase